MWRIEQLMSGPLETVPASKPVGTCLALMRAKSIRHLPVLDASGGVMGLVSDMDLLRRTRAGQSSLSVERVVVPCGTAWPDEDALTVLARQLRDHRDCTLVMDRDGCPLGLFTDMDGLELARRCLTPWMTVSEVMTNGGHHTADQGMYADKALEYMFVQDIHHLVVVDDADQLVGVVSHRDLAGRGGSKLGSLVGDTVYSARLQTPVQTAVALMVRQGVGCLPVLGPRRVRLGVLTRSDVLRALAKGLLVSSMTPAERRVRAADESSEG